jgi:uncharacterized RDD family membrane protein YckC
MPPRVAPPSAPPPPPQPPPPPSGPPSYPTTPGGGYGGIPPTQRQYGAPPFGAPAYGEAGEAPLAPWGTRLGGYLIDAVIFIPVLIVLAVVFRHSHVLAIHFVDHRNGTRRRSFSLLSLVFTGVLFLVYATYLCGGPRGQTVGMRVVGVRVVRDGTHDVLGYGLALGRAVVEQVFRLLGLLSIILGLVWVLDMLFPLWDKKRQTLHDKIVKTVVIQVDKAS